MLCRQASSGPACVSIHHREAKGIQTGVIIIERAHGNE